MKRTYFLDKIYNANHYEFEKIIKAIIEDLNQEEYPFTFFKRENKWVVDIEREKDLITIEFDDYSMILSNNVNKRSGESTCHWQRILYGFLTKKQKLQYNKNLDKLNLEVDVRDLLKF